jgi:hypothetical protein
MWTASGLGSNMDPQQEVIQQQFMGPITPYQFQETSYNMMPLQQIASNRTPTRNDTKITSKISPKQQKLHLAKDKEKEDIEPNRRNKNGRKSCSL